MVIRSKFIGFILKKWFILLRSVCDSTYTKMFRSMKIWRIFLVKCTYTQRLAEIHTRNAIRSGSPKKENNEITVLKTFLQYVTLFNSTNFSNSMEIYLVSSRCYYSFLRTKNWFQKSNIFKVQLFMWPFLHFLSTNIDCFTCTQTHTHANIQTLVHPFHFTRWRKSIYRGKKNKAHKHSHNHCFSSEQRIFHIRRHGCEYACVSVCVESEVLILWCVRVWVLWHAHQSIGHFDCKHSHPIETTVNSLKAYRDGYVVFLTLRF